MYTKTFLNESFNEHKILQQKEITGVCFRSISIGEKMINKSSLAASLIVLVLFISIAAQNDSLKSSSNDIQDVNIDYTKIFNNPAGGGAEQPAINRTILPKTNLTVSSYLESGGVTTFQDTFNASVLSLNRTHWFVHCDYSLSSLSEPSFDSIVNRTSENHVHSAFNYWSWDGNPSPNFDFWIDTIGFYIGYQFDVGSETAIVSALEPIYMAGIEQQFNAWKIVVDLGLDGIITMWYATTNGLFLSVKNDLFALAIWYNITKAEIDQLPQGYTGPKAIQLSHNNNSRLASNTLITLEFASPYGVDIIYYHWDEIDNSTTLLSFVKVNLPETNESHDLFILAFDNVGYSNSYHFVYITDNTLPGISLITPRNNTKIQGSTHIQLQISSGNGSIIYQWDGGDQMKVDEGTLLTVPTPELEIAHILNVEVQGETELWASSRFSWIVDNTPPEIVVHNPRNGSVIKGIVKIEINSSENCNLTYWLVSGQNKSLLMDSNYKYTLPPFNLENGTYILNFYAYDEANNIFQGVILFSVYTSAFSWEWSLNSNTPSSIDVVDFIGELWFILTVTSNIKQNFTLALLDDFPSKTDSMLYVIDFSCGSPEDIVFMTFILPLNSSIDSNFSVYKWVYWDIEKNQWVNLITSYNAVSHAWEATYEGGLRYFALEKTGETTATKSVIPGGGQIPSFEFGVTILGLLCLYVVMVKRKKHW